MKKVLLSAILVTAIGVFSSEAQYVSIRLEFPVGVRVAPPPPPPPFVGAIWIAPEWTWRSGRYVCVPGYWAHPQPRRAHYAPGYWKRTGHGYHWKKGHWR